MILISPHFKRSLRLTSFTYFRNPFNRHFSSSATEEKIIKSPAPFLELPKGNFVSALFKDVDKWRTNTALECSVTGRMISYTELIEQSTKWSGFLKQIGFSKGDIVCLIAPNCIQYGPIFLGTAAIGAVLSPINYRYTSDEICRMLEINNTKLLIFSTEIEQTVLQALKGRTENIRLLSIGKSSQTRATNVDDILDDVQRFQSSPPDELGGEETLYMPFSSGTTGPPKAVALSHNALIGNIYQFTNPYHGVREKNAEVVMGMLPFFHIYGMVGILCVTFFTGGKVIVVPKFDRQSFLNTIIHHKVNKLHTVPTLLNLLNNSPKCNPETMGHISTVMCGAAPVHKSFADIFKKKINKDIMFIEAYGMTETLGINMTPRTFPRLGTTGQLLSNIEAKVINLETGETLGPNESGEICIKTPSVMQGYVNNPEATKDILREGWIHTGDIGHYDADGFFFIIDRTKDLIKVQGMQVSPSEIEKELQKHPSVEECSVIGVPDERAGEIPKAFVVLKREASESELRKFLENKLAKHKQLRGGITFKESLPKSETGKILKKVLRTMV